MKLTQLMRTCFVQGPRPNIRPGALALALFTATAAFVRPAHADPPPPHGIVAAQIGVRQLGFDNPPSNIVLSNKLTIGDFRIRPTANKGDYDVQIGEDLADDVDGGVLISSIAENGGRDNLDESGQEDPIYPGVNTATSHIDYSRPAGGYFIPIAMTYPNSLGTTVVEYNLNVNAAWFPYDKWLGAFIRNATAINGGPLDLMTGSAGLQLGKHFVDLGGGKATVNLTSLGINSQTDGVLLVMGAKNEDNYGLSMANADGTWTLFSKDNGTDGASTEQDPFAFVYIPKTNTTVISGRFAGDGSVIIAGGTFTIAAVETGGWELKIPGYGPDKGVLLVTPEGGQTQNRDNIVSADANAARDGWIIESRDLPTGVGVLPPLETPGIEPVASFVFVPGASPGVSVTPSNNLFTTENGGTATFTVTLDTKPIADVTIAINSDNTAEGTVSPASLTFTADNWNVPQTITVTGQDDDATDGPVNFKIVLAAAVSADTDYNGRDPVDVSVTNLDNDGGFTVVPTGGLVTTEAGGAATFAVRLDQLPTADVTINFTSSDTTEGTVSPETLTFTSANGDQAQTVTVTGVDDSVDDGDVAYTIHASAAVSADPFYNGKLPAAVAVKNTDDDTSGVLITPTVGLIVVEGGTTTYQIVLTSQPTSDVTLNAVTSDATEASVTPAAVTFTAANWNIAQTVTINGMDDLIVDGAVGFSITNTIASSDTLYAAVKPAVIFGTTLDNEALVTLPADSVIYGLGMPAIGVAGRISIVDTNTPDYNNGAATVGLTANASADDRLEIRDAGTDAGQIGVDGANITYGGTVIGTFSGGTGPTPLAIRFNAQATPSAAEALLRNVTFRTGGANPSTAPREVTITLTHGDGAASVVKTSIGVGALRRADFQEGADWGYGPYVGAGDIELYELQPDSPKPAGRGTSGLFIDWRDADTPNTGQVLLRFDNLVGDAPGQVPTNAIIVSAELFLHINDSGDGSPLYRMLVPWDAQNETWNSIGGGITPDDVKARSQFDSQIGVVDGSGATTTGTVWVSVTPDIRAWVSGGETNYGWVMPAWPLNLDGTGFSPSEAANLSDRPRLRVLWLPKDSASIASFRQGVDGYTGAVDTRIRQNAPDTEYLAVGTVFVDAVVSGTDPNPEQVLLRFDDIVGTNPGQIPPGSKVHAAMLDLASINGDAMGDGGNFYALLQAWPEVVSWNGWVDGIQTNGVEAAALPSATAGSPTLNPDVQGGFLSFDLTADVQDWVNGAKSNFGWMINPWPGGGNGWGFTTSENATENNRPRLRVFFTPGEAPVEITLLQPAMTANGLKIQFNGTAGKTYSIYRAGEIDGAWTKIGEATPGSGNVGEFTDGNPQSDKAFYRVGSQ